MNQVVQDAPSPVAVLRAELQNMEGQFKAALPAHIPVERFMRVVMTALQNNPDLVTKVDRRSLWNSAMRAAQDGLLPDGREGAIVSYGSQAQWMPMIAGIRKKVRNSGEIATWEVQVVHEKDAFEFELGDEPFIKHKPYLAGDSGGIVAAYSIAVLKSGEKSREVMTVADIERVRSRSKARNNGPWVTDYSEMCRKTVARRHSKVLPMSTDLDDLLRRDDDLYDFDAARTDARAAQPASLAGRLDALAALPAQVDANESPPTQPANDDAGANGSTQQAVAAASGQPASDAPASDGNPEGAARQSVAQQSGAGTASTEAPAGEPKTAAAYEQHAAAWIETAIDPDALEKRWKDEKNLRNKVNVDPETRDELAGKVKARAKHLRDAKAKG